MQTTLRSLADETLQSVESLMQRLELDPEHHDVEAVLRPRVARMYRLVLHAQDFGGAVSV